MISTTLGFLGGQELIVIALALLLLFGGRKIPELMRGLGKGIREFKDAQNDDATSTPNEKVKEEQK
ncbi:Sec-independent protein translocase subunit TatA/TatB [Albibacterium indicum]|uniref:Sec-independent protein translocase subunit TatA/TatB n=1 Tax=Albibacterium indicum TaxID=2292082 RepID=UPI000E4D999C|nr:twin-arginine translocase TatA/TatE family subunit [Pedobacter indicus]